MHLPPFRQRRDPQTAFEMKLVQLNLYRISHQCLRLGQFRSVGWLYSSRSPMQAETTQEIIYFRQCCYQSSIYHRSHRYKQKTKENCLSLHCCPQKVVLTISAFNTISLNRERMHLLFILISALSLSYRYRCPDVN